MTCIDKHALTSYIWHHHDLHNKVANPRKVYDSDHHQPHFLSFSFPFFAFSLGICFAFITLVILQSLSSDQVHCRSIGCSQGELIFYYLHEWHCQEAVFMTYLWMIHHKWRDVIIIVPMSHREGLCCQAFTGSFDHITDAFRDYGCGERRRRLMVHWQRRAVRNGWIDKRGCNTLK